MLRYTTDRARPGLVALRHPVRKRSGSILTTPETARGEQSECLLTSVAVQCIYSGNALVSINAVALHRAWLVVGWVIAFGQVNCLTT